ncbi:MAG: hypothetical protein ACXWPS_18460 [Ktedonobacteraceae bacterium]
MHSMRRRLVGDVGAYHREGLSYWLYLNLVLQWFWNGQIRNNEEESGAKESV